MEIIRITREDAPAVRFIGRRYAAGQNYGAIWGQWWQNGWFDPLDQLEPRAALNGDATCSAMRVVNGELEYWIGMFFEPTAEAPEGYESVDIGPMSYAVCWLKDRPESPDLFGLPAHERCVAEMGKHGFARKEDDWCFERYQCPRYTTPDDEGRVILDYGISIEP